MSEQARATIGSEAIEAVADRGYYSCEEILACEETGITVFLPKPMTSGINAKTRFGKQDFLCRRGRCLSLPRRREANVSLYE